MTGRSREGEMSNATHVYIGRKPGCRCVVAMCVDDPATEKLSAREVAGFIRSGLRVERVTLKRSRAFAYRCAHEPAAVDQGQMELVLMCRALLDDVRCALTDLAAVTVRAEQAERENEAHKRAAVESLGIYLRLRASVERLKATVRRERQRGDTLERWSEDTSARWHDQWERAALDRDAAIRERDALAARLEQAERERNDLRKRGIQYQQERDALAARLGEAERVIDWYAEPDNYRTTRPGSPPDYLSRVQVNVGTHARAYRAAHPDLVERGKA